MSPRGGPTIAVVALLAGGALGFLGAQLPLPTHDRPTPPAPTPAAGQAVPVTGADAARDALGRWVRVDYSGATDDERAPLVLRAMGAGVVAALPTGRLVLAPSGPRRLTGKLEANGSEAVPASLDLNLEGDQAVLVLAPPASEYVVSVLWKEVAGGLGPAERLRPAAEPSRQKRAPVSQVEGPVSEATAVARVRTLPEVAAWLATLGANSGRARFAIEGSEPAAYTIRVYEAVPDGGGGGHSATFGWWDVDRQTGEVTRVNL